MSSNDESSNASQQVANSLKKPVHRKKFTEEFEQLLNVEISQTLWVTVHKSRSAQGTTFVDIRRKKEGQWQGKKIYIPTRYGLFLKYKEYEKLKERFYHYLKQTDNGFQFSIFTGRTLLGEVAADGKSFALELKTESKESKLVLTDEEIIKLNSHSVVDGIAAAMCQSIYD